MLRRFEGPCGQSGHGEFLKATTPGMQGPPPRFLPPSPPPGDQLPTLPTDEDDDSQYETPDRSGSNRAPRSTSSGNDERSALISSELPFASLQLGTMRNGNCYKPTPSLSTEDETHQLLKLNPQTGSYFIPNSCK
ncbi:hypothetical protein FO519_004388 [Halicephalobus sp. NKZ332]|nr:hypothetical protein FO519_004388 [Halicephalobus sp. NKZ332]